MITRNVVAAMLLGAALAVAPVVSGAPAFAISQELESFIGAEPATFDTPEAAIAAFKDAMAKGDIAAIATLLGLDPVKVEKAENIAENLKQMREATAQGVMVEDDGGQKVLSLGRLLWPFPFPVVKGEDGKWAFDTIVGLEEIVNRRIGQNELHAIETMRLYVEAQRLYAGEDHDGDGVIADDDGVGDDEGGNHCKYSDDGHGHADGGDDNGGASGYGGSGQRSGNGQGLRGGP